MSRVIRGVGWASLSAAVALGVIVSVLRWVMPLETVEPLYRLPVDLMLVGVGCLVLRQSGWGGRSG